MKNNIISMHYFKQKTVYVETPAYEFVPHGRLAFLQTWLWIWLKKLGSLKIYNEPKEEVKRIDINRKDFSKNLLDAYFKCFPGNRRPNHVFIGPDEFEELIGLKYKDNPDFISFDVEMGGYGYKVFDLPVEVVPHMKGVLII